MMKVTLSQAEIQKALVLYLNHQGMRCTVESANFDFLAKRTGNEGVVCTMEVDPPQLCYKHDGALVVDVDLAVEQPEKVQVEQVDKPTPGKPEELDEEKPVETQVTTENEEQPPVRERKEEEPAPSNPAPEAESDESTEQQEEPAAEEPTAEKPGGLFDKAKDAAEEPVDNDSAANASSLFR